MLTKERLDAFLSSGDVQLDIDIPGYNGTPVPTTLIKRRIGTLAYLLYCTFCKTAPSGMGEHTCEYQAQDFYQLMVFAPKHEAVFVLGAGSPQVVGPHLGPFVDVLKEWYAEKDRRTTAARTNAGRKMMAMYVDELHKKYSDAAVITEVIPDLVQSLDTFCTRYNNDGNRVVQENEQINCLLASTIPVPDLIYPSTMMRTIAEVYDTPGRPFSAFDAYYTHKDEDSYIAALYEDLKMSYEENGYEFLQPQHDPLMEIWASFVQAWTAWRTDSRFDKYRAVRKAVEESAAKNVIVTFFANFSDRTNSIKQTFPASFFTNGIWDVNRRSNGDFVLRFWQPKFPQVDLSLLKSISYRGKVLYEDTTL